MISLPIQDRTALRLRRLAPTRATTVEELAEQAVDEFLHSEERRAMRQELDAYSAMHGELLVKYKNQYVAIYRGQLVGSDPDMVTLAERVNQLFPDATPLITPVHEEPIETFMVHSPRLVLDKNL